MRQLLLTLAYSIGWGVCHEWNYGKLWEWELWEIMGMVIMGNLK